MQYRVLVLGAGGFAGGYLRAALEKRFKGQIEVIATSRSADPVNDLHALDVTDTLGLGTALREFAPTHVINLAGVASPMEARRAPELAWKLHALAPEALGRLIRDIQPEAWLFHVSSGLVYGRSALSSHVLTEESLLEPMDPYAVTKAAGDLAMRALAGDGLKCLVLRPFNHIGPGQTEDFVIPSFAAQLARISRGEQEPVLRVGNLEAERDFLDVRDVADAYACLVAKSQFLTTGEVFNLSSGKSLKIRDILDRLIAISGLDVHVEPDPKRQRPSDVPRMRVSSSKLRELIGAGPVHSLDETLRCIYEDFVSNRP